MTEQTPESITPDEQEQRTTEDGELTPPDEGADTDGAALPDDTAGDEDRLAEE